MYKQNGNITRNTPEDGRLIGLLILVGFKKNIFAWFKRPDV